MPWCPKCRYEYRPEIQCCPNCGTALEAEPPPPPPKVAGWRVEEKTARGFSGFKADFTAGLHIACRAARITFRARKLLLFVILLVTLYLLGCVVSTRAYLARNPQLLQHLLLHPPEQASVAERWLAGIHRRHPLDYLIQGFDSPLAKAADVSPPWLGALTSPLMMQQQRLWGREVKWDFQSIYWIFLFPLWQSVIVLIIDTLIVVGLLGWLFALASGTRPKRYREYLKNHYTSVLAITLLAYICFWIVFSLPPQVAELFRPLFDYYGYEGRLESLQRIFQFIAFDLFSAWLFPLALLLLAPAPFAIVARNLGAWGGVKTGARILWQRRWAFLALFFIYRVIYEVIQVAQLSLPSTRYLLLRADPASLLLWPVYLAFALLGLWLAMAFMLLIMPAREPAPHET